MGIRVQKQTNNAPMKKSREQQQRNKIVLVLCVIAIHKEYYWRHSRLLTRNNIDIFQS